MNTVMDVVEMDEQTTENRTSDVAVATGSKVVGTTTVAAAAWQGNDKVNDMVSKTV